MELMNLLVSTVQGIASMQDARSVEVDQGRTGGKGDRKRRAISISSAEESQESDDSDFEEVTPPKRLQKRHQQSIKEVTPPKSRRGRTIRPRKPWEEGNNTRNLKQ